LTLRYSLYSGTVYATTLAVLSYYIVAKGETLVPQSYHSGTGSGLLVVDSTRDYLIIYLLLDPIVLFTCYFDDTYKVTDPT